MREWRVIANGHGVSFQGNKNILELGGSDAYAVL